MCACPWHLTVAQAPPWMWKSRNCMLKNTLEREWCVSNAPFVPLVTEAGRIAANLCLFSLFLRCSRATQHMHLFEQIMAWLFTFCCSRISMQSSPRRPGEQCCIVTSSGSGRRQMRVRCGECLRMMSESPSLYGVTVPPVPGPVAESLPPSLPLFQCFPFSLSVTACKL
jgi:hypothetical protein